MQWPLNASLWLCTVAGPAETLWTAVPLPQGYFGISIVGNNKTQYTLTVFSPEIFSKAVKAGLNLVSPTNLGPCCQHVLWRQCCLSVKCKDTESFNVYISVIWSSRILLFSFLTKILSLLVFAYIGFHHGSLKNKYFQNPLDHITDIHALNYSVSLHLA